MKRVHLLGYDPQSLPEDFWRTSSCEILILDKWASIQKDKVEILNRVLPDLPSHVWIASSGTLANPGESKWMAISKTALLESAKAVNTHLQIKSEDSWGLALPLAHVGGLGIMARAYLLGNKIESVVDEKWDPLKPFQASWISLVPTQLFDLVKNRMRPSKNLKGVIIGGDKLDESLYQNAIELGWPILRSFGMSECASQIATETSIGSGLKILPHMQLRTTPESVLQIQSKSLFTGSALITESNCQYSPREGDWFESQDCVEIKDHALTVLGRRDFIFKVKGEKVNIVDLESEIQRETLREIAVLAIPDQRDGIKIVAAMLEAFDLNQLNKNLLPHQRIQEIFVLKTLPRSPLGKYLRGEILNQIMRIKNG
ncbi:MAG: AMP-binding protein [Bacteriovoracaceae bacterium]|nr:AMP-binding protein [Bacteriovoracaceae bacterium]